MKLKYVGDGFFEDGNNEFYMVREGQINGTVFKRIRKLEKKK